MVDHAVAVGVSVTERRGVAVFIVTRIAALHIAWICVGVRVVAVIASALGGVVAVTVRVAGDVAFGEAACG